MPDGFAELLAIALTGALASPAGGALAIWKKPTSLTLSVTIGFAAGILLGTFAFEMLPKAAATASLGLALAGFTAGFASIYLLDMLVHHGASAGDKVDQRRWTVRKRQLHKQLTDEVTVIAGGTSAEELVEGITIGVSAATDPRLGMLVGLAIVIDNFSEALSIGELIRASGARRPARRIYFWTGLIGFALLLSALAGWLLLRGLPRDALGFLLASGAGGMFYLTIGDLVPEAESRHVNQSAAVATATGFLLIFALSSRG